MQERKKYIFDEKKRVYESIVVFSQIILFPEEARYSLGVAKYDIQTLSNEDNIRNAVNDLKMTIPKLRLISKDDKLIKSVEGFIEKKDLEYFDRLVYQLRKDLYM